MKVIFLSDLHLAWETPIGRLDSVADAGLKKMTFIDEYAERNKIDTALLAGDVFDVKRSWFLLDMYTKFFSSAHLKYYAVRGQHDSYYHSLVDTTTIFGVLENAGLIRRLYNNKVFKYKSINVYGASYGEPVPKIFTHGFNILVIHKQILMKKIWSGQEDYTDARELIQNTDFDVILCGDAHQKFLHRTSFGRVICNTGPLMRLEATDSMIKHQPEFFVFDTDDSSIERVLIPCRPAKEVLTRKHLEEKQHRSDILSKFIDSALMQRTGTVSFDKNLKRYILKNNVSGRVRKILSDTYTRSGE